MAHTQHNCRSLQTLRAETWPRPTTSQEENEHTLSGMELRYKFRPEFRMDIDVALTRAVTMGWWRHAAVVVQDGASAAHRDATLLQAAEQDQWDFVVDALPHGASLHVRDAVFLKAAQTRRWVYAGKLLDLGVSPGILDRVFSDVVDGDVWLCSNQITAGWVSPALRDRVLRRAMELGRVSFVVELLRQPSMTRFSAFVLDTAIGLENSTLVVEMVKLREELQLGEEETDAACRAAVSARQWACALFLVERGVQLIQEIVVAVRQSGTGVLALPALLKTSLIKDVIELNRLDALRELLYCFGASEKDTEEAFDSAVSCRNEEALRVIVSCANRNSQLLKKFCATKSDVYPTENFTWICGALKNRYTVLSLDIALAANSRDFVEHVVLSDETGRKLRRMFLLKVCANSEDMFRDIANNLVARLPRYRRSLFLMSVRQGYHSIALALYGKGVSLRDVEYAICFISCSYHYPDGNLVWDYIKKLNSQDGPKLLKGLVRTNLDYFVSKGENDAEFLYWFGLYCGWQEAETSFVVSVFRRVYKAAVRWDAEDCFVESINRVMEFSGKERRRMAETLYERGTTAYNDHVSGKDTSNVVAAIDFALKKQKFSCISQILYNDSDELVPCVLKRSFRKGAWPVFDTLFEMLDDMVHPYFLSNGQVFIHCLSRTVVKVSDTLTIGASDTATVEASDKVTVESLVTVTNEVPDTVTVTASDIVTVETSDTVTVKASDTVTVETSDSVTNEISDTVTVAASDIVTVETSDTVTVETSDTVTVEASDTVTVKASVSLPVEASDTVTVETSDTVTVEASDTVTVKASVSLPVEASDSVTVAASDSVPVEASDSVTVAASDSVTVEASDIKTVDASDTRIVGALHTLTIEISETRTVGAVRTLNEWLQSMCPSSSWYDSWLEWDDPGCLLTQTLGSGWRLSKRSGTVLRLAEFSSRHGCHGLTLLLAAVLGAEGRELMERVVASHLDSVDRNLVLEIACYAVKSLNNPAAAAVLIKHLPLSAFSSDYSCVQDDTKHLCLILTGEARDQAEIIAELKRANAHRWVLVCQLVVKDFTEAEKTLTLCNSHEYVDVLVQYAAACSRADVVRRYAPETSGPDFLQWLLSEELGRCREGNAGVVRCLLNLVGTSGGERQSSSYLSDVCPRLSYRPRVAGELARCLVSLGAAAQHRGGEGSVEGRGGGECPLKRASLIRELQLVKLFHRSGVCSNERLFEVAEASHGEGFWGRRYSRGGDDDVDQTVIQSYLTFAARCPLSLQDLCRHGVSSSLGGGPGYLQRVQALPVPTLLKEFILFSDMTQDQSD